MPGRDGVPHMLVSTSTSLLVSTDRLWHPGTSCWLHLWYIARGASTHRQQRDLERCSRLRSSATMTFRPTRLLFSTANIARCVPPPLPSPISHLPAPHTLLFLPLVPFIDCVCHAMPCRFLVRLFNFVAPASFSCRVLCSGGICTGHCCEGALLHARDIKRLPATGGPTATTLFCGRGTGADPSCCGARASGESACQ